MMKRIITILLAMMMVLSLTACGSSGEEASEKVTNLEGSLSEIIDKIYAEQPVEFPVGTIEVDLSDADAVKAYTGLDSTDKIKEATVSESMMGSQAYSLVLVRLNDANDAETVANEMKAGIDPAKWICVEADDLSVVAYGDTVMLIMVGSSLSVSSEQIVTAFKTVCGGTLSVEL